MSDSKVLKDPILGSLQEEKINNPSGSVNEEIRLQEVEDDIAGGYDSAALGNKGRKCSLTVECQELCNWISWGSWK